MDRPNCEISTQVLKRTVQQMIFGYKYNPPHFYFEKFNNKELIKVAKYHLDHYLKMI